MTFAPLRDYTPGLRTQAEVARDLGISVRTLQRIEDEALALYLLGIARAMREAIGEIEAAPQIPRRFSCRMSENRTEDRDHAERAGSSMDAPVSSLGSSSQRARHLFPRRFGARQPR